MVGFAGVRHFAQLDGWEVVAVSRRTPMPVDGATFISVDLLDARQCDAFASRVLGFVGVWRIRFLNANR